MSTVFTKKHSSMIQGMAILLMVYHHFFLNPMAVPGIKYNNSDLVMTIAWFGKICVGLFCFVSGFGLFFVMNRCPHDSYHSFMKAAYLQSGKRILQLYLKFWTVLFLVKGFSFLFLGRAFRVLEFIQNMFTIQVTYNGAWWFLRLYLLFLLLMPLIEVFFTHFSSLADKIKKWITLSVFSILFLSLYGYGMLHSPITRYWTILIKSSVPPVFFLIFGIGYLFARFSVFDKIFSVLPVKNTWFSVIFGLFCILFVTIIRIALAKDPSYATLDFLFVPVWILGCILLLNLMPHIGAILDWFGSISTFLWLIHVLIYDYTVDFVATLFSTHGGLHPTYFYLLELCLSSIVAYCFTKAYARLSSHVVSR